MNRAVKRRYNNNNNNNDNDDEVKSVTKCETYYYQRLSPKALKTALTASTV